jgi:hypothetical protein
MKNYWLVLGILYCSSSFAQQHTFEYGIQTALNINSAYGNAVTSQYKSSSTGFGAGVHIQFKTGKHTGIKTILQFDQNGWSYRDLVFASPGPGPLPTSAADVFYKLNYINLPVLATYAAGKKIKFTAGAGFFTGLLVSDHFTTKIKTPAASTTTTKSNSTKSFNFGIAAEAGIQVPLQSKLKLDIGIHDNYGLTNTLIINSSYKNEIKTNAFSFVAGISMRL